MSNLTIPNEYRSGLSKLLRLNRESIPELVNALREAPLKFYRTDLSSAIKDKVRSVPPDDLNEIVESLWSLEYVRASSDVDMDQFLDDLHEAVVREKVAPTTLDRADLEARVRPLLEASSISTPAKGRSLLMEGRTYCRARVLTDIRPVFDSDDVVRGPRAALIVHNLRISYHEGRGVRDFTVLLDSGDVDALIDALMRAKTKQQRLKGLLDEAKTPYLDVDIE